MKNWKQWLRAALIRAIRTFAQTAAASITGGAVGILDVDWVKILSVSFMAFIASMLTSLATGLPEVEQQPPDPIE